MMNELSLFERILVWFFPVMFAITVHEIAHGWMAKKFGDDTASKMGRMSLNPIKHIDPLGTIIIPGILLLTFTGYLFGWAKPVPVDPRNFKHPRQNMAVVALAGPLSNLLMAIGWALIARIGVFLNTEFFSMLMIYPGIAGISINLILMLINLLPIPPLDGGRVLVGMLPIRLAYKFSQLERYGFLILLLLLFSGVLNKLLGYPMFIVQKWFFNLAGL
ncbi:MAG: site-2 protease family protein [Methylomonas sp.]|nr:MAG: site-2 protease family protein [Methylobacter sp.]PPD32185.1 MAG: site-2 protease family protein [Methylomonas sp.]